ncbi:TonB-dependent receptor [Salmonirosea aquatica]|uniref:TonB-dependent receptor plug domain-containing protein n=1 Tax=Salmonirosea aquatica TaxID=2654236 RepID=A0A7C9BEB0_9BACT|nr:TonB-dependent receptor plug domain-containing protein [Cytophagaceae bacterium SJW1-29]
MMKFYWMMCFLFPLLAKAQQGSLTGLVQTAQSEALPHVSLYLVNTNFTTTTDEAGRYLFEDVPYGTYNLVAQLLGYRKVTIAIRIGQPATAENVQMTEDPQVLDEVVVAAEKTSSVQQQRTIPISSIDIREIITQNNLLTDIADRIAGVRIRRSSSLGERSDISINGMRGNAIRVYVDGLPMEFLYPSFDISTLPLGTIRRLDVYKGVVPVDVGTDAMGGAINIITEQKAHSHLRASYSLGSFNTHLVDFEIGLANRKNFFINANASYNYSDNDYPMRALVFERNRVERVRRFHDAYSMAFGGVSFGVHSRKWADELRFTANYSTGFKELQNGARVSTTAFGEVEYRARNYGVSARYEKAFMNDRFKASTLSSYSHQALNFVDTTANVYSWSGQVVGRSAPGEYVDRSNYVTYYNNFINRTTLVWEATEKHRFLVSNLWAHQQLTGQDHLREEGERDYLSIPQYLAKNIAGLQYNGKFSESVEVSAALKRFDYQLNGAENNTLLPVKKKDGFWGWNAGLKYNFTDNFFARASYERGFLIPFFEQFVGNGADILRNTDLIPENSDNVNLGWHYTHVFAGDLSINTTLNGFWHKQNDIIFLGNGLVRRYENTDQVKTIGLEGELILNLKKAWTWRSNITTLRKRFSALKDPRNAFLVGTTFPNNPTFFANTELGWETHGLLSRNDKFRVYVYYLHVAPFNHILIGRDDTPTSSPDSFVPTQNRIDVGTSYRFAKPLLTLALNINNILNAQLFDNFLVPRAGIHFNVKLLFEINQFQPNEK